MWSADRIYSLKYLTSMALGCHGKGIRKLECVAKT